MGIGGDPTGVVDTQKGPHPGSEDALSKEGLLPLAEIPAPRTNHNVRCLLRRATGPRFLAVYLAGLVLVVLALGVYIAVLKSSQCPDAQVQAEEEASRAENVNSEVLPPCGEGWIWFRNKCYYFSEQEANWTDAEHACASLNSSLAVIDNQREMDFVRRYKGKRDHWIGLRRDSGQPWKWANGTEFSNWFTIKDFSDCAFLNSIVQSSECYSTLNWICISKDRFDEHRGGNGKNWWQGRHFTKMPGVAEVTSHDP
ncbi:early activation antigen CD69-like isoform X1 [Ambystoma mexicanum]|uniref:early activation antigen CD69-like isoform X1 n=1 Tax=Ambystoma mexicanum TaxID=8296 RepID=UPI0037E8FA72